MIHSCSSTKIYQASSHANDAHHTMSKICGSHHLDTRNKDSIDFQYQGVLLPNNRIGLGTIQYGADVAINVSKLKSYSISLPFSGKQQLYKTGATYKSNSYQAVIVSNREEQSLVIEKNCQKFQIVIPESSLQCALSSLIAKPITEPIIFEPLMQIDNHTANKVWWQNIELFISSQRNLNHLNAGFWAEDYENFLIKSLLFSQTHNYSHELESQPSRHMSDYVVSTKQFIIRHAKDNLTVNDICQHANVSKSKLYSQFKLYYGMSPMNFLKKYRLEQIHKILNTKGCRSLSISQLAYEWGFNHLGRFSKEYSIKFKETPSETLKRNVFT